MKRCALAILVLAGCAPGPPSSGTNATPIVKGDAATADPAVVALVTVPIDCGSTERQTFCTGTLIAPRVVLTAAHCLEETVPSQLKVYVGDDVERSVGQWLSVFATRSHPAWDGRRNDIAALILESDAPMPPVHVDTTHDPAMSDLVRLVGFGADDGGRVGGKRQGTARVTTIDTTTFSIEAAPGMSCLGDSGGPVFLTSGGVETLVGVTSFGDADCRTGTNTRVSAFGDFVSSILVEVSKLPAGPRPLLDPSVDTCARPCVGDFDCPRDMQCTARVDGSLRCAFAGLPPGSLQASCTATDGCIKERCVAVPGSADCRCYHECDAEIVAPPPPPSAAGGGCSIALVSRASDTFAILFTALVFVVERVRKLNSGSNSQPAK
ncbi:MAG: S1 family peptidase [Polyangiales bacterium]